MASWHGFIFSSISRFWANLRIFAYENRTIFEVLFVLLYAIEQFGLVWFSFTIKNPQQLVFIVSVFAIIVLTTFSLHKILMESRIKLLEEDINEVFQEKINLESKTRHIHKKYNELLESYNELKSKDLNKSKRI